MDRSKQLGEVKVSKLLMKFSIPAIVGMLVNALYNVVDRIFIGNGIGYEGIAGITIAFPVMLIMMAFSMLIGIGANSLVSIRLGENKKEEAEGILGNALSLLILISLSLTVIGSLTLNPLLKLLGASEKILPYARDYLQIILIGAVFQSVGMGMNNFIRSEGNPKIAMYSMLIGAVVNTILDPIFIFGFRWGMRGAAIATIISQATSAIWVISYFLGGKSLLKIHTKNIKLRASVVSKIVALGAAPFAMQLAASVQNFIMNTSLATYGGDIAISGMGVVNSIVTLMIMPIFGINQGVQPIIGYNYGAKKYDRVKEAYKLAVISATVIITTGWVATRLFPEQFVSMFNSDDKELISFGTFAIKRFMMFFPIIGFQIVSSNYFQAVGKPKHSALLSLSRQVLILIPALLILPRFFGLEGVVSAGPLADVLSSVVTGTFIFFEMKKLDDSHQSTLLNNVEDSVKSIFEEKNIINDDKIIKEL
ncbi:putative MATE family efflux protein [Sedimentibacter acidaminivorans]|jgi:MATE family, multidrug efflux pump|uniref:Multidrug export protein MepA n=1 Tax=Sedimentibacter acidaminivorans TaxID=913099 RepID=A0ABS4GHI1_9FIRM|nr:MATE family efflux transporter [Sedimentibacter acidaminivorans]MBP1927161.1 putative MATE family efflux protein [Sedimentibacter acidaminivorans]